MSANDEQVGGNHYIELAKGGESHWDMMWRLYREAWFVGNITKYVLRYRRKEGVKDLKKARHYLDKLIELEEAVQRSQEKQNDTPEESDGLLLPPSEKEKAMFHPSHFVCRTRDQGLMCYDCHITTKMGASSLPCPKAEGESNHERSATGSRGTTATVHPSD